jgi:hypothetical protein
MRYDPRAAHEKFRDRGVGLSCIIVGNIYWNPLPQVLSGLDIASRATSLSPAVIF